MSILVAADMSQLELRIAAAASKDPVMIEILSHDPLAPEGDMHIRTAAQITGLPLDSIPKSWRNQAKIVNYLSNYDGRESKLIEGVEKRVLEDPDSGLTVPTILEARRWLAAHHALYERYWKWKYWTLARVRDLGYAETMFGRPRFFPDINSYDDGLRKDAERAACNHVIQGTAADLLKMAMIRVAEDPWMSEAGYMTLQVHDEIVSIVHRDEDATEYGVKLDRYMQCSQPFLPDVKLVVDVGYGSNWKDTHK